MELCFKQLALPGEAFIWDQHNIVYLHNGISGGQRVQRRNRQIDKHCQRHNGPEDWVHLTRILTKIKLHNLYKTSATKYQPNSSFKFCLNFNFKILTKPCAQSLNKSLALWTILSSQICNKLLPIQSSSSTLATVTISTSFELVSSHARVTSIKFTKQEWVSEWVSESLTSIANDWTRVW